MIIQAEIINQPYSGEFEEKIYDNESPWNSQGWTWIKFTNDNYYEWCGQFRGFSEAVGISNKCGEILVLTSDYLFRLDSNKGEILELEDQPQYNSLAVAPSGEFILGYYYHITKVAGSLKNGETIESPILMDMIEFKDWDNGKLIFTCDEFMNWDRHLEMELDTLDWVIKIKKAI